MACFLPFNNRNLDIVFFIFKPTIVIVDELVEVLKQFSLCTESLGCIHSAIFRSIHGNMIVWYGAWIKRSDENKESLDAALLSMLTNTSSMAILVDHAFFEAYGGESRDGSPAAKFHTGDTISMNSTTFAPEDMKEDCPFYACLAIFRDNFPKMDGAIAGVCLRSKCMPRVVGIFVWKSLQSCYSYILNQDNRRNIMPYFDGHYLDIKYDIFKVVYVSGDNTLAVQFFPPHKLLKNQVETQDRQVL